MNQDGVLFFELLERLAPYVEDERARRKIAAEITVDVALGRDGNMRAGGDAA
jgi:hypothetical protein